MGFGYFGIEVRLSPASSHHGSQQPGPGEERIVWDSTKIRREEQFFLRLTLRSPEPRPQSHRQHCEREARLLEQRIVQSKILLKKER